MIRLNDNRDKVLVCIKDLLGKTEQRLYVEEISFEEAICYSNIKYYIYTKYDGIIELRIDDKNNFSIKINTKYCNSVKYDVLIFVNELKKGIENLINIYN